MIEIIHNQGYAITYKTVHEAEACDHHEPKPKIEFTKAELNVLTVLERGLSKGDIFVPMQLWPVGMSRCEVAHALRTLCQKITAGLEMR